MRFLTAEYVFPIMTAPVEGGILVIGEDGSILDLIDPANLDYEINDLEKHAGFLCPGFINSHCHLELSWAKGLIDKGQGLDHFLKQLEVFRKGISDDEVIRAIQTEGDGMLKSGIVAVGDISNGITTVKYKQDSQILFHTFAEAYGSDPAYADWIFNKVSGVYQSFRSLDRNNMASITPHATYSLSPELFRLIADDALENRSILSIHHQESEDENLYFLNGTGKIAARRQFFNPEITPFMPTGLSPIESIAGYFSNEQVMMLVHNTISKESDLLAGSYFKQLYWCFCPNANLFIENRLPDTELFRKHDSCITLGTDSLASNTGLSALEEIKTIQAHFPWIPLCEMLKWATYNGAEALGFNQLGSFEKGRKPGVVLIENPDMENLCLLPGSSSRLLLMHGYESYY
jgi:aminodeoxyfutalosine deaminase